MSLGQKANVIGLSLVCLLIICCRHQNGNDSYSNISLIQSIQKEIYQRKFSLVEINLKNLTEQDSSLYPAVFKAAIEFEKSNFQAGTKVITYLNEAFLTNPNDDIYLKYLEEIGSFYIEAQEDSLALTTFNSFKTLAKKLNLVDKVHLADLYIGKSYMNLRQDSLAESYIVNGFIQLNENSDSLILAYANLLKSQIGFRNSAYDSVLFYATQSLSLYEGLGHIKGMLLNHLLIASSYFLVGIPDKADDNFKKGINIAIQNNEEFTLMKLYVNYGNLLTTQKRNIEAKEMFEKAYKINKILLPDKIQLHITIALANLCKDNLDLHNALEYYKATADIALKQNNIEAYAKALLGIGNVYHASKEKNKAVEYYKKMEAIIPSIQSPSVKATMQVYLGMILPIYNKTDEGIKFCLEALEYADKNGMDDLSVLSCTCLVDNYKHKKNIEKVEYYLRKQLQIKEEFFKKSTQIEMDKSISKINYEKSLLEKELNISSLQKQLEVKNKNKIVQNLLISFLLLFSFILFVLVNVLRKQKKQLSRINDKYKNRQVKIDEMNLSLKTMNANLKNFAIMAAKDIKAPLNTSLDYIENMEKRMKGDPEYTNELNQFFNELTSNNKMFNKMIDDLLLLSNLDSNLPEKDTFDLHQLILDIIQDINKETKFSFAVHLTKLPNIYAHKNLVRILFQNILLFLIDNCMKKTDFAITINSQIREDGMLFINIETNCNQTKTHLNHIIFNAFEAQDNLYQSNGIGLASCKKIVEIYEGEIWTSDQPNKGNAFHFTINVMETKTLDEHEIV
jgi:signal transduction histidine kinase